MGPSVADYISTQNESLFALYRQLHASPELSFMEEKTSARMAEELRSAGFETAERVGGHGIVGVLPNGEGPTVWVRTDMDALPILEETGLPFANASSVINCKGDERPAMHACGHDLHMTNWVGVARTMAAMRDQWSGTLVCFAQPAEETVAGAKAMLDDGLFERFPAPDAVFGLHIAPDMPAGTVGWKADYFSTGSSAVNITIFGRGGHGSTPQKTVNPILVVSQIALTMQTIVSQHTSPLKPAIVNPGVISGGTADNIVPDEAGLGLNLRAFDDDVLNNAYKTLERIVRAQCESAGCPRPPKIHIGADTPSIYNDPKLTRNSVEAIRDAIGAGNVIERDYWLASEDFSLYGRHAPNPPIFFFELGCGDKKLLDKCNEKEIDPPGLHNSKMYPDFHNSIHTGIQAITAAILQALCKTPTHHLW